jgi:hypothetical protein
MSSSSNPQEFWPFFPIAFVGIWLGVMFVISLSGWHWFAIRYPAQTRPSGTAYTSPSTRFWFFLAGYRNVVRVILTQEGIYFYVLFLFRPFHPPFLVPWESVARVEKTTRFFWPCYQIDIADSAGKIHVILPRKIESDLLRFRKRSVTQ